MKFLKKIVCIVEKFFKNIFLVVIKLLKSKVVCIVGNILMYLFLVVMIILGLSIIVSGLLVEEVSLGCSFVGVIIFGGYISALHSKYTKKEQDIF